MYIKINHVIKLQKDQVLNDSDFKEGVTLVTSHHDSLWSHLVYNLPGMEYPLYGPSFKELEDLIIKEEVPEKEPVQQKSKVTEEFALKAMMIASKQVEKLNLNHDKTRNKSDSDTVA